MLAVGPDPGGRGAQGLGNGYTVYVRSADLLRWLEDQGVHHVLEVPRNESLWVGMDGWTTEAVHAVHGDQEWNRLSAGADCTDERGYDWLCRS